MPKSSNLLPVNEVRKQFARLLGLPDEAKIEIQHPGLCKRDTGKADMVFKVGATRYGLRFRNHADVAGVVMAVHGLKQVKAGMVPLVVVPYMGPAGMQVCRNANIGWFDLSGNGHLEAPGLRVHVEGKPNAFKRPGRPGSVFAPKSARIARWLLMHPDQRFSQSALARATNMGKGFVSRIVRGLEEKMLIIRDAQGAVRPRECNVMLDAWREVYSFSKHEIVRGHIAARSGEEILRRLHEGLARESVQHAATGLAAAWLWTAFAGYRLVVVYVAKLPSTETRQGMGFREVEQGENVWLVMPDDPGVFHGCSEREGIPCVHPVQIYLDLKDHPERSAEAAGNLRQELLTFANHA